MIMNRTAQILLNVIVGIFAFVFFLLVMFPLDTAIGHFLQQEEANSKGRTKIQVAQIDASLIFDSVFKDFRVIQNGEEVFYTPELRVDISLLPLLFGKQKFSFEAKFIRGSLTGRVERGSDITVDLEFNQILLSQFKALNRYLRYQDQKIPLKGSLDGSLYLVLENNKPVEGEVDIKLSRLRIGPVNVGGFEIPALKLSNRKEAARLQVSIDSDNNQIDLKKLSIPGPDLMVETTGAFRTARNGRVNRIQIDGTLNYSAQLLEKLPLLAMAEQQKNDQGVVPFSVVTTARSQKIKLGEQEFPGLNLNQLFQ